MSKQLILIGMTVNDSNIINEYILYDIGEKQALAMRPIECIKVIESGTPIVGLNRRGKGVQIAKYFFKHKGILGKDNQEEVWTVIKKILYMCRDEYILCNQMGKTMTITKEELKDMLTKKEKINGVKQRKTGIMMASGIETVVSSQ